MQTLTRLLLTAMAMFWIADVTRGQEIPAPEPADSSADSAATIADTHPSPTISPDKLLYHENKGFFESPTGTLLKSVVIPGWGQLSNGKEQKAAIYAGIETYFFVKAMGWRGKTADRLRDWETSCDSEGGCDPGLFNSYDSARDRRNYFYWLLGTTVFVSMFDAYADRYLITLERTRDKGDDYWGGQASAPSAEEWWVLATVRF